MTKREFFKVVFEDIRYYRISKSNMVCNVRVKLIDANNGTIVEKFSVSATSKCNPNDEYDDDFAKNLSFSRAKIKIYSRAYDLIESIDNQYLPCVVGMAYMSKFLTHELNHEAYLCGWEEPYDEDFDIRKWILYYMESKLPMLRGEHS